MNPLTNMKNVTKLSENELKRGGTSSWHDEYKNSAWIFVGGLPYDLTEGDVIAVFSQFGEIVNINMIRDKLTGKQKGFCFICYEDQRSTVLTVDNLNGIKILGKSLRVDHVKDYKPPKDNDKYDDETRQLHEEGCAPRMQLPTNQIKQEDQPKTKPKEEIVDGVRLPMRLPIRDVKRETDIPKKEKKEKKSKKHKKEKKSKKDKKEKKSKKNKKRKRSSSSSRSSSSDSGSDSETDRRRKKYRH
ncbi:RNA-binding motif protein, X-linked 2 [Contarinia nasturtii]|uniref:RNA-binding motif protein, X-linked 2 n=1 Tax=Contarinia nasturtii TaxID=265458 RepID=UPI0012D43936|nr:RNA-binding motif protein, X-linked 2 [Contarinia nasturtii]